MSENTTPICDMTAHAYADNFTILDVSGFAVGLEHNETEAKALVAYLNGSRGGGFTYRKNRLDQVRAAQAFRSPHDLRHPLRDEAFEEMGVGK